MRVLIIFLIIGAGAAIALTFGLQKETSELNPPELVEVKEDVQEEVHQNSSIDALAILDKKCSTCHGRDKTKGSFNIVRLLNSGLKQEEVDGWNEVYRVINEGDMPPEDEEQLSDLEKSSILNSLKKSLKSSKEVSRLLTAQEIIQTLSDVLNIDPENDNQMENLYSYQDKEFYSTIDNQEIMSVFFMNDYSKILDDVINEYVSEEKVLDPKEKKRNSRTKAKSAFDPKKLEINSVGFASRSHYWPEKEFVDLRGRYSPHANALKEVGARNLNLQPGIYRLELEAATFNRKNLKEVKADYSNDMRLLKEKAKLNIYLMPVYSKTRPSSFGKQKLIESVFIEDNKFKTYTFEIEVKRATPIGIEFENAPHSKGRLKSAFKGNYPKDGPPPKDYKHPYIRFKNMHLTFLKPAKNMLSLKEVNEASIRAKISALITKLGISLPLDHVMDVFKKQIAAGNTAFQAYKKTIKSVFLSPDFLYLENSSSEKNKIRFASYNLLKSAPGPEFSKVYSAFLKGKTKHKDLVEFLSSHENFKRFSDNFVYEWMHLHEMAQNQPDEGHFKEFYMENFNYAFNEQTKMFINNLFKENRPVREIVQSDYTFVNDNLSRFYGLPASEKPGFRKVKLKDSLAGGLLTQGSFLAATSNGVEALPFRRAEWISANILNKKVPPPPDNISVQEFEEAKGSFTDKMKVHSTNKACSSCHKLIDPIADKMRYFNGIGKIEKHFKKSEVAPQVQELKEKYTRYERKTAMAFCRSLLAFSTGRKTDISDYETIEKIVDESSSEEYAAGKILEGIVKYYF